MTLQIDKNFSHSLLDNGKARRSLTYYCSSQLPVLSSSKYRELVSDMKHSHAGYRYVGHVPTWWAKHSFLIYPQVSIYYFTWLCQAILLWLPSSNPFDSFAPFLHDVHISIFTSLFAGSVLHLPSSYFVKFFVFLTCLLRPKCHQA